MKPKIRLRTRAACLRDALLFRSTKLVSGFAAPPWARGDSALAFASRPSSPAPPALFFRGAIGRAKRSSEDAEAGGEGSVN